MEVMARFWLRFWGRIALAVSLALDAFEDFVDEASFRAGLAYRILRGRVPLQSEKRPWIRSVEGPTLCDVYSWIDDRLLFSILIWPSLESDLDNALRDQRERVEEVLGTFANGAAEKMWSTYWEIENLEWDNDREVWVDSEQHAYDGRRMYAYARGLGYPGEYPDPPEGGPGGDREPLG